MARLLALMRKEEGQVTLEYVLVALAAAGLATVLITWIGRSKVVTGFFSSVFKTVTGMF